LALQALVRALDASGVSDNLGIEVWSFHAPIETPHPLTLSPFSSPSSSLLCSRLARTATCCNGSHDMARAAAGLLDGISWVVGDVAARVYFFE